MAWAYAFFAAGRSLTLVYTVLLARLLDPRDFGLVALALVFTAVLETVADVGLSQALSASPNVVTQVLPDNVLVQAIQRVTATAADSVRLTTTLVR